MTESVLTRLAALKTASMSELKRQWADLFDSQPPPYNRRFLESRLAYRIQEPAYGGLTPAPVARLEALGEELAGGNIAVRRTRTEGRPIAGPRLLREYKGERKGVVEGRGVEGRVGIGGGRVRE